MSLKIKFYLDMISVEPNVLSENRRTGPHIKTVVGVYQLDDLHTNPFLK